MPSKKAYEDPPGAYFFTRYVPDRGYCWLTHCEEAPIPFPQHGHEGKPPVLIPNPESKMAKRYQPLRDFPTLYLDFAKLPFTDQAILDFANKYGWLGVGEAFVVPDDPPAEIPTLKRTAVVMGEGRNVWHKEIQDMDFLVQLWQWRTGRNVEKLSRFLRWDTQGPRVLMEGGIANKRILDSFDPTVRSRIEAPPSAEDLPVQLFFSVVADAQITHQGLYESWTPGDPIGPITLYIADEVNKRLQAHVSPRLLLNPQNDPLGYIVPKNLLGALWLQFYQAITGQQKIRTCAVCGNAMDVTESRSTKTMHESCARREQMRRYHAKKKKKKKK